MNMSKQMQSAMADTEPSKHELEVQMQRTRESLAETVGEIKETVEQEYQSVRQTVSGVLDFREQFKNEPLVWSLGALSAGFALGYTVGYAHKNSKGSKHSQLTAFASDMVDQLSTMGQGLVVPALSGKIQELFGIDFADLLKGMGERHGSQKKKPAKKSRVATKARVVKRGSKKKKAR
jgi:hypothetical protein